MTPTPAPTEQAILERLAAELTARQYDVLRLHLHLGKTMADTCRILGIDRSTGYQHLDAAQKRLQKLKTEGAWPWT